MSCLVFGSFDIYLASPRVLWFVPFGTIKGSFCLIHLEQDSLLDLNLANLAFVLLGAAEDFFFFWFLASGACRISLVCLHLSPCLEACSGGFRNQTLFAITLCLSTL